jgi:hypothetical protein
LPWGNPVKRNRRVGGYFFYSFGDLKNVIHKDRNLRL